MPSSITESAEKPISKQTAARRRAAEIAALLRSDRPDYDYLRTIFRLVREELRIRVPLPPRPEVVCPTDDEVSRFVRSVAEGNVDQDRLVVAVLLLEGLRAAEVAALRLEDVDLDRGALQVSGRSPRRVPIPAQLRRALAVHCEAIRKRGAAFVFESSRREPYTERGLRKLIERYAVRANLQERITPKTLRNYWLAWLRGQGLNDGQILLLSGHATTRPIQLFEKGDRAATTFRKAMASFPHQVTF